MPDSEYKIKQQRLIQFLDQNHLDGVLLTRRDNFSWASCGKDNYIPNNSATGVATMYLTRDQRVSLANTIEAPRMRGEEFAGTDVEVVDFPWYDSGSTANVVRDLIGGKKVGTDSTDFGLGLAKLPGSFDALRWSLTDEEIARYRDVGARASKAIEDACRSLKPGMTGHEVAGVLDHHIHTQGLNPVVTLVSGDESLVKYRHPIPKPYKINRHAMLVTCGQRHGLIACCTRFVHFGPMSAELKQKQQAIANIDTAVNFATKPGRTLGEIFADLQHAYETNGHAGQWQFHHQGGSTGYNGRDVIAMPGIATQVVAKQAFAWNPSIVGAKSEDTMVLTEDGFELITQPGQDWPKVTGRAGDNTLERAGVLES
jgi:Xaa-Pro aminopeptidase